MPTCLKKCTVTLGKVTQTFEVQAGGNTGGKDILCEGNNTCSRREGLNQDLPWLGNSGLNGDLMKAPLFKSNPINGFPLLYPNYDFISASVFLDCLAASNLLFCFVFCFMTKPFLDQESLTLVPPML